MSPLYHNTLIARNEFESAPFKTQTVKFWVCELIHDYIESIHRKQKLKTDKNSLCKSIHRQCESIHTVNFAVEIRFFYRKMQYNLSSSTQIENGIPKAFNQHAKVKPYHDFPLPKHNLRNELRKTPNLNM